jgi:hypothetical protein
MRVRLAIATTAAALVLAGCGSQQAAAPVTSTATRTMAVTTTSVSTQPAITITETPDPVTETETDTVTESAAPAVAAPTDNLSTSENSTTAPATTTAPIKEQKFSGTGDDVVKIEPVNSLALIKFDCPDCSGNVTLTTDGSDGLLVNTIGSYSGTHFFNVQDGSTTSQLTITAGGSWTASISDYTEASTSLSGRGDTALFLSGSTTAAKIKNTGTGNFVVQVYAASGSNLAVNEIGSYNGTVPLELPALVQITSEGTWSISPQ